MPVQNYNINTRDAVAGVLYGMSATNADVQTRFNTGAAPIAFGLAVQTDSNGRGVTIGGLSKVYGISLRQVNRTMNVIPGQGEVFYKEGEDLAVVSNGRVVVQVSDAVAADHNKFLFVDKNTGTFAVASRGADDAQTTNVKLDQQQDSVSNLWSVVIMNSPA